MSALPDTSVATVSLVAVAVFVAYRLIIYPAFVSALSRIPNAHWSSSFSPVWILWIRYKSRENVTVHDAHRRLGSVVRLGPSEISVNCVKNGIHTIYTGGFEKHRWYANIFSNYGVPNMFCMTSSRAHSARKRMLSNVYSKSYIQSSPTMREISKFILYQRLIPRLRKEQQLDVFETLAAATMDYVTGYIFGLSVGTDFLGDISKATHFLDIYMFRRDFAFWPQELPRLNLWASQIGVQLTPDAVAQANQEIEQMSIDMVDAASEWLKDHESPPSLEKEPMADFPVVLAQLQSALNKGSEKMPPKTPQMMERQHREIASELLDHLAAGFETSAITLTYVLHELSQRPDLQVSLRQELKMLETPIQPSSEDSLPDAKALDSLPWLHAIVYETLRLHSAIPGGQPRITPQNGCTLGGFADIPGGVRVNAQAYSLHRNEDVFPEAEAWRPERWLMDNGKITTDADMMRWFWAFSSGGRMCVGSNLAMYQMKFILAAIYTNFETEVVDDTGIEQMDAYTAPPKSSKLILNVRAVL